MTKVTFVPADFRVKYPAFAANPPWTDEILQGYFDTATCYIANNGCPCCGDCSVTSLYLMTAHLAALSVLVANGEVPGYVTSATIDKITVTISTPPAVNQWQWWLNLTPYGQQLLALLQVQSAGGFYFGGLPETAAMRRVGGILR